MKKKILIVLGLLANLNVFAAPVIIQNLSSSNAFIPGGYAAHVYLGIASPSQDCNDYNILYVILEPGNTVQFSGTTAYGASCIQEAFWGVSCSDTSYDQIFPGIRFHINPSTISGSPVPNTNYIAGIDNNLACLPPHEYTYPIQGGVSIMNPSVYNLNPLMPTIHTQLRVYDYGFMKQYLFF